MIHMAKLSIQVVVKTNGPLRKDIGCLWTIMQSTTAYGGLGGPPNAIHRVKYDDKTGPLGTSLAVQWLRLCLPMQGVQVRYLVGELRSHVPHSQKNQKVRQKQYCNKFNKDLKKKKTFRRIFSEFCNKMRGDLENLMYHTDHRSSCDKALERIVKLKKWVTIFCFTESIPHFLIFSVMTSSCH